MPRTKKTFNGYPTSYREPVWAPLLAVVGHRLARSFMWMSEVRLEGGRPLHIYKHRHTRRLLRLTPDGEAFTVTASQRYRITSLADALGAALEPWPHHAGWADARDQDLIEQVISDARRDARMVDPGGDHVSMFRSSPPPTFASIDTDLVMRVRQAVPETLHGDEDACIAHALRMYTLERELWAGIYDEVLSPEDRGPMLLDEEHHTGRHGPPFGRFRHRGEWEDPSELFDRDGSAEHSRAWVEGWEDSPPRRPDEDDYIPF